MDKGTPDKKEATCSAKWSVFGGCRSALERATGLSFRPMPVPSLHK